MMHEWEGILFLSDGLEPNTHTFVGRGRCKVCYLYRYIHAYNLLDAAHLVFEYIHLISQKLVLPTVPWFGTLGPAFHPFLEPQAPGALTTER